MRAKRVSGGLLLLVVGCSAPVASDTFDWTPCDGGIPPGVSVEVRDSSNGSFVCGARVFALEVAMGQEVTLELLSLSDGGRGWCLYRGVERPGRYVLTVSAGGYATDSLEVEVTPDGCSLQGVGSTILLVPE